MIFIFSFVFPPISYSPFCFCMKKSKMKVSSFTPTKVEVNSEGLFFCITNGPISFASALYKKTYPWGDECQQSNERSLSYPLFPAPQSLGKVWRKRTRTVLLSLVRPKTPLPFVEKHAVCLSASSFPRSRQDSSHWEAGVWHYQINFMYLSTVV